MPYKSFGKAKESRPAHFEFVVLGQCQIDIVLCKEASQETDYDMLWPPSSLP